MMLFLLDFEEIKTLHPMIEQHANMLIDEYYNIHTSITKWESIEYNSKEMKYITPFEKGVRYTHTDGTFLYYMGIIYDAYKKPYKIHEFSLPVSWLFDNSWKEIVTLQAYAYRDMRNQRETEIAEDKKQREIKYLLELLEKYQHQDTVQKWIEDNV